MNASGTYVRCARFGYGVWLGLDCILTGMQYSLAEPITTIKCLVLNADLLILFKEVWLKSLFPASTKHG